MDTEHLQQLAKRVAAALGSLKHAEKQAKMYPGNTSAEAWHAKCEAAFVEAHNAYIEYANEHLA